MLQKSSRKGRRKAMNNVEEKIKALYLKIAEHGELFIENLSMVEELVNVLNVSDDELESTVKKALGVDLCKRMEKLEESLSKIF